VDDRFGTLVAISTDKAVVGAPYEDSDGSGEADNSAVNAGAAYVFERSGSNWSQVGYLKASNVEADDSFSPVAISGDTIVISAPFEDGNDNNEEDDSGAAYVFAKKFDDYYLPIFVR